MKRKPKCKILDAFGWPRGDFTGYVVCHADKAGRPVCFVDTSWGMGKAAGLIMAEAIAANPARLEEPMDEVYDLRFTGAESGEPMPAIIYTLMVGPHGKGVDHSEPFRPFCPFLLAELHDARDRMQPARLSRAASGAVRIDNRDYAVSLAHGRLFLNGLECDAICHHDEMRIEVSDQLDKVGVARAVATAVAESWMREMQTDASLSRTSQAEGPSAA